MTYEDDFIITCPECEYPINKDGKCSSCGIELSEKLWECIVAEKNVVKKRYIVRAFSVEQAIIKACEGETEIDGEDFIENMEVLDRNVLEGPVEIKDGPS